MYDVYYLHITLNLYRYFDLLNIELGHRNRNSKEPNLSATGVRVRVRVRTIGERQWHIIRIISISIVFTLLYIIYYMIM